MMNEPGLHMWGMGWGWILGFILLLAIVWVVVRVTIHKRRNKPPES